jgi:hypothetical protein
MRGGCSGGGGAAVPMLLIIKVERGHPHSVLNLASQFVGPPQGTVVAAAAAAQHAGHRGSPSHLACRDLRKCVQSAAIHHAAAACTLHLQPCLDGVRRICGSKGMECGAGGGIQQRRGPTAAAGTTLWLRTGLTWIALRAPKVRGFNKGAFKLKTAPTSEQPRHDGRAGAGGESMPWRGWCVCVHCADQYGAPPSLQNAAHETACCW